MLLRTAACALVVVTLLAMADGVALRFVDVAAQSGLTIPNTYGGKDRKDYILESTGNGAAIFDFDGDGFNDIFIANGTSLAPGAPPTRSQLYRNDGHGHFADVSREAGLTRSGWAQAACVGDFDNDGHPDFLGQNTASGDVAIWSLNGSHVIAWHDVGATPARVVGVGDFDGDGNLDFLGQFTDGTLAIWFMKNYRVVGWQPLGSPGSVTAVGVADIDNDGHADVLGIDPSTHRVAVWFTNGRHVIGFQNIGDLSSGIQVRCAATLTR